MRTSLAIALLLLSVACAAQELGTLFHTAKEREALDRLRRGEPAVAATSERPDPAITGFVKRSDGKSTVFIDRRPYPARGAGIQGVLGPRMIERFEPLAQPADKDAPADHGRGQSGGNVPSPATPSGAKAR